jgi:hypothetical protein
MSTYEGLTRRCIQITPVPRRYPLPSSLELEASPSILSLPSVPTTIFQRDYDGGVGAGGGGAGSGGGAGGPGGVGGADGARPTVGSTALIAAMRDPDSRRTLVIAVGSDTE